MNIKKIDYRENRCKNACDQWFGAGTTNAALCKGYCYLLGDAQPYWDQLPKSKADYLNRFVTDANPKVYYKSPIVGQIPGSSQSWGDWRDSVFKANTVDCKAELGKNEEATCNKFTGYFSKYLGGKLKDTLVPLSLRELYSYSNPYRPPLIQSFSTAKQFCETLMYANGQIVPEADRPYCCGGNGPNFSPYDPFTKVLNEMQPEINATKKAIEKKISDTAKIIKAVWVIAVVIVLIMLLLRFF